MGASICMAESLCYPLKKKKRKENILWGFPGAQWLGLDPSTAEAEVRSLVRKVRSHKPHSQKKKKKKRKEQEIVLKSWS